MAGSANIDSVDTLLELRANLIKFGDNINSALIDSESEVRAAMMWLSQSQPAYWKSEEHRRREKLMHAKAALRQKQTMKKTDGSKPDVNEELLAVKKAEAKLEEAEEKQRRCKKWARQLEKDVVTFKGMSQRLMAYAEIDVPQASAKLERLVTSLESYLATIAPNLTSDGGIGGGQSVKRALQESKDGDSDTFEALIESLRKRTPHTPWDKYPMLDSEQLAEHGVRGTSINESDLEKLQASLKKRKISVMNCSSDQEVLYERQALEATNFYMERLDEHGSPFWFFGNADTEMPLVQEHLARCSIGALLEKRPDLKQPLDVGIGHMILVESGRIISIVNLDDNHIWPNDA